MRFLKVLRWLCSKHNPSRLDRSKYHSFLAEKAKSAHLTTAISTMPHTLDLEEKLAKHQALLYQKLDLDFYEP